MKLFFSNLNLFFKNKKSKKTLMKEHYEQTTGLPYEQIIEKRTPPKITILLMNAVLIFLGVYGTILFYTSCFDIPFQKSIVIIVIVLVSLYASFLYYNSLIKNLGYILFLLLFLLLALSLRRYANSGFAAIYNITYDVIDEIYQLPAVRHLSEMIDNRYLTITVCLCFLGTGGAILLNTAVSSSMNLRDCIFITFPFLSIGLYFNRTPSIFSIIMLFVFYVSILILRKYYASANPNLLRRNGRGRTRNLFYPSDGKIMGQILIFCFCILSVLFLSLYLIIPNHPLPLPEKWKSYKEKTDDAIRTFMIVGFSGFYNRYDAKGGISGGRLGGVASIRPTFETDLVVRFTPYDLNTVYLKSFTGTNYQYDHWETSEEAIDLSESSEDGAFTTNETIYNTESAYLKNLFEAGDESVIQGRMEIKNVDANTNYPYLPYYAFVANSERNQCVNGSMVKGTTPYDEMVEWTYYRSFDESVRIQKNHYPDLDYYNLPNDLRVALFDFCMEIGLEGSDEQTIAKVVDYFQQNYPYSMSPGATPQGRDFVSYFLFENKKGFCAHFASAATLLFRAMDIPARYVEGYAIPVSRVMDSDMVEGELYHDWLQGNAPLGETAVVEVEVNDSMAHAWVEVWFPDRGWIPVDVTPSSSEEEEYSDFWSYFNNLLGSEGDTDNPNIFNFPQLNEKSMRILNQTFLIAVVAVISFLLFVQMGLHIKRHLSFHTKNYNVNLANRYQWMCKWSRRSFHEFSVLYNQTQQLEWIRGLLIQYGDWDASSFESFHDTLRRACYSSYGITREEYDRSLKIMKQIQRLLYRSSSLRGKCKLIFAP